MRLAGKIALITGAGSGIGQSTAERFAREGAAVIVNDLEEAKGRETVRRIDAEGGSALFLQADVTDSGSVSSMVREAVRTFGRIDVLFNNAGISGVGAIHEVEPEDWDRVIRVNVRGDRNGNGGGILI